MNRAGVVYLLMCLALGCGKYGPPVRAGAEQPPERKPSFELPLPSAPAETTPLSKPEPAPEPAAPIEEEPPLEGAP